MKASLILLILGTVCASADHVTRPLGEFTENILIPDPNDNPQLYKIVWNSESLPSNPSLSINKTPRDPVEADIIVSLKVFEEDIFIETKEADWFGPKQQKVGTRHVSTFVMNSPYAERSTISIYHKGSSREKSTSLTDLISFYHAPENHEKEHLARKIVSEAGLPLFPTLNTYTLDYNREKLEILDHRSTMVLIRLKWIYQDTLKEAFSESELKEIESFTSSEIGGRFFDLINFKGEEGDLLEKSIDEVSSVIYKGIHENQSEAIGGEQ